MELKVPLEIDGFVLREFEEGDIRRLSDLANDREIWRHLTDLFPHPYDLAAARHWISRQVELDPSQNLVIAGPEGLAGGVGLLLSEVPNFAHDGELGYWLGRRYWGRGIATSAVRAFMAWAAAVFGLRRFTAKVFADNEASMALLDRCGFEREGIQRRAAHKGGVVLDLHLFGRILDRD